MKKVLLLLAFVFTFTPFMQGQWFNANSTTPGFTEFGNITFGSSNVGYTASRGYNNSIPGGFISKTTDAGQNWNVIQNFTGHDIHFTDANTGYVARGTEIRKTSDGGLTWTSTNLGTGFTLWGIHFFGSQNGVAVGTGLRRYYTNNAGASWTLAASSSTYDLRDVWFADATTVFAGGTNGRVYRSTNAGATWVSIPIATNEIVFHVHFPQNQPSPMVGYVLTDPGSGQGHKMYKTTNGGFAWTLIQSFPNWDDPYEVFFTNANTGYWASLYRGIARTTDGGLNWTAQQTIGQWTGDSTYAIHFTHPDTGIAVGNGARVLYTYNGGQANPCATLSVDAGPDTVACQGSYTLNATVTGGSGNYNYNWSPSAGLSNPFIPNPVVTSVSNQTYYLLVQDGSTGCLASDTVEITVHQGTIDSIPWCNDTLILDLGPGANSYTWLPGGQTTQTITVDTPGVFLAVAQFPVCGAITSAFTVYDTCSPCLNFTIDAGPDSTYCGAPGQLNLSISTPGPHSISWWPAALFDNPNSPTPNFSSPGQNLTNQFLEVTVYDSTLGCLKRDTLFANYYNYPAAGTDTICRDSVILDLGSGGINYQWQPSGTTTQTYTANSGGVYIGIVEFPGCPVMTSTWQIVDVCDSVWPGDANSDLIADNFDVLNVGVGYNSSGAVRPGATSNWTAQWAPDWPANFSNNVNYKHADCQGDGVIDSLDLWPILNNYGLTHNKGYDLKNGVTGDPPLYLQFPMDSIQAGDSVSVDVILGSQQIPANGVYGLAFSVLYDSDLVDSSTVRLDYDPSWFTGSNTYLSLGKNLETLSEIDGALSRTNQQNINGYGKIATLSFVMEENIALKAPQIIFDSLKLYLADVKVIGIDEQEVPVELIGDTAIVWQLLASTELPQPEDFRVHPNPVSGQLNISSARQEIKGLQLFNNLGQVVTEWKSDQGLLHTHINVSKLPEGIYHLRITTQGGNLTKKIIVLSK